MEEVFKSFCSFGDKGAAAPMMDGAKLAKLSRDCKILDKHLTSTDVDIIFTKVKSKTEFVGLFLIHLASIVNYDTIRFDV